MKISILDNSASGTVVYSETHTPLTNSQGLYNLNIGQGTPLSGIFSGISWGQNTKFIKVELDPAGGTSYTSSGTSQLMSVPYALYAESVNPGAFPGTSTSLTSPNGTMIVVYTGSNAYGFAKTPANNPQWFVQSLSGTIAGAVALDSTIVVYTTSNAYAFTFTATGDPQWYVQSISGTTAGAKAGATGNVVVYTSSQAYGLSRTSANNPQWYVQSLSGTPLDAGTAGGDIVVTTTSNAYGFSKTSSGNPQWYVQSLSGTPGGVVPK